MVLSDLVNIKDASKWASKHTGKLVSPSNITYLVQYGRIRRFGDNGSTYVSLSELENYYAEHHILSADAWKAKLGDDLNWALSFDQYKESETTKHVHRLHPYKGKFIPQLVEYFLDTHTDRFKPQSFFSKGDIVLDPFVGSGTTLVQSNELGLHAVGIDVSAFNVMISGCKIGVFDYQDMHREIKRITLVLQEHLNKSRSLEFEKSLLSELNTFNSKYFPSPEYKFKIRNKVIDEKTYSEEKSNEFLPVFQRLVKQYNIQLEQENSDSFLDKWYIKHVRDEIDLVFNEIKKIDNPHTKRILAVVLSRTMRSCRATTHSDLATLTKPITSTYYCVKHGKICKPLFSILKWWNTYSKDTIKRLQQFDRLRTKTEQVCITGDSRNVNIVEKIRRINPFFANLVETKKIKGIFTSPPYVGMIDYHEQHAYAYDLFGFERKDDLEIGPLYKGQGAEAKRSYVDGVSEVLLNCKQYMQTDYDVFLVSNDKYSLYPQIAQKAGMRIVNQYKRPVLNRTERDKNAYSEIIFHLKEDKA